MPDPHPVGQMELHCEECGKAYWAKRWNTEPPGRIPTGHLWCAACERERWREVARGAAAMRVGVPREFPDLPPAIGRLLWRAGFETRASAAQATDADLLVERRIGKVALAAIRAVFPAPSPLSQPCPHCRGTGLQPVEGDHDRC